MLFLLYTVDVVPAIPVVPSFLVDYFLPYSIVKWVKEQWTAKNDKPCSYNSAIAPTDEINMSADRGYFREPSLKRVSVHNN